MPVQIGSLLGQTTSDTVGYSHIVFVPLMLFLVFFLSPWLLFFSGLFLEDCIIRGKWLLNKCLPSFWNQWKFQLLWALFKNLKKKILFQLFFLEHLFSSCVSVCVPIGCFLRLRRVWLEDLHICMALPRLLCGQRVREKNRCLYWGTAKDKGHNASVNSLSLHTLHRPSTGC